jgi:hypothetical protein
VQADLAHSLFALSVDCFHQSLAHTPRRRTVISGMRIERNGLRRREEEQLTTAALKLLDAALSYDAALSSAG